MAQLTEQEIQDAAVQYFGFARWLALKQHQRLPFGWDWRDDLVSEASIALMSCLRQFNPNYQVHLKYWIQFNVKKRLLDFLRREDPLPQRQRERVKLVQEVKQYLDKHPYKGDQYRREPVRALIETLGWSEQELQEVFLLEEQAKRSSLEEEKTFIQVSKQTATHQDRTAMDLVSFQECLAMLTSQEKRLLEMRFSGYSLAEMAAFLGEHEKTTWRRVQSVLSKVTTYMQSRG